MVTCFLEPLPSAGLSVGSGVGGERGILRGVTWKRTLESSSQGGETDPTTTHYPRPDDRAFRETILIGCLGSFLTRILCSWGTQRSFAELLQGKAKGSVDGQRGGPLLIWDINCTSCGQWAQLSSVAQSCLTL